MNETYREVLPLLRPRSGDLGWLGVLAAGILLSLFVGALVSYLLARWRHRARVRRSFYATALERHLSKAQIRLLLDLAAVGGLRDPLLLLTSLKAFDRLAGQLAGSHDRRLDALVGIRHLLGFDDPAPEQRLYSTRALPPGQVLMVWPVDADAPGFLQCLIADRDERSLTVVPMLRDGDRRLSSLESGDRVKVRFWRRGDTEYRFRSRILATDVEAVSVRVRHAERLERVQLRDFYRVRVRLPIQLFVVPEVALSGLAADALPGAAVGTTATATDISGGGLGVQIAAEVPPGSVVIVDPDHKGTFPLAGVRCQVVGQQRRGTGWQVRLQFADLAAERQDDLAAAVFTHQARAAGR